MNRTVIRLHRLLSLVHGGAGGHNLSQIGGKQGRYIKREGTGRIGDKRGVLVLAVHLLPNRDQQLNGVESQKPGRDKSYKR